VRALVQRVSRARVTVDGAVTGEIGGGLLVLFGATHGDGPREIEWLARKTVGLRIFPDDRHHMNRDLLECGGAALVVPQFTLYGDARRGRRPDFTAAARPEVAEPLFEAYCAALAAAGVAVARGVFGARMEVELVNDGPVTVMLETPVGAVDATGEAAPGSAAGEASA
jgi:D-aminoacyl-tRNA deacylase